MQHTHKDNASKLYIKLFLFIMFISNCYLTLKVYCYMFLKKKIITIGNTKLEANVYCF